MSSTNVALLSGEREAAHVKSDGCNNDGPSTTAVTSTGPVSQVFTGLRPTQQGPSLLQKSPEITIADNDMPRSVARPISPPPTRALPHTTPNVPVPMPPLTVRKLKQDPAQFTKRMTLLKALFNFMDALNSKLLSTDLDASVRKLHLSEAELRQLAIDEEASVGEKNRTVYENVMRQRLVTLKKMTPDDWIKERRATLNTTTEKEGGKKLGSNDTEKPKPIETGLSSQEEVTFLSRLIASQRGLDQYGYITKVHTQDEIDEAQRGVDAFDHWEKCDRCDTRFQVFPNRRKDGALTTGGKCQHHWGRKQFIRGEGRRRRVIMTCCRGDFGSPGCAVHDTHVFKVSGGKRLSTIMPFVETPENSEADPDLAVCFDCEMGYTTFGLELLRLTAVAWPSHEPMLDLFVRPLGHILDINTRFSGITFEQFINTKCNDPKDPCLDIKNIRMVESPYVARALLLSQISPRTPLLGHALENDLNCIRLVHPTIVDTVLLYPHPSGLPARNSLKLLAEKYLDLNIQMSGAAGHDSLEDAQATGELVRYKVAREWRKMKGDGWTFKDGVLSPPIPAAKPPMLAGPPSLPPVDEPIPGNKRNYDQLEENDDRLRNRYHNRS